MANTRLEQAYKNEIFKALMEKFGYKNPMQVPKLEKITLNIGLGEAKENSKLMDTAIEELKLITGQKPIVTKALPQKIEVGAVHNEDGYKFFTISSFYYINPLMCNIRCFTLLC